MTPPYLFNAVLALKEKLAPHGIAIAWEMEPSGLINQVWVQLTDPHNNTPVSFPVFHPLSTEMDVTLVYGGLLVALEGAWVGRGRAVTPPVVSASLVTPPVAIGNSPHDVVHREAGPG